MYYDEIAQLLGLTFKSVEQTGDDGVKFITTDDVVYLMEHRQDCCESVYLEDITGDLKDLVGSPILVAEESCNYGDPKSETYGDHTYQDESSTWTFYKLATNKGWVDFRWYGSSNGYYSESAGVYKQ